MMSGVAYQAEGYDDPATGTGYNFTNFSVLSKLNLICKINFVMHLS